MAETAAHLTDHVFPRLPVRQWVLSVPKRLRYYMQRDGAKKALDAYLSSNNLERELREKQAAGPPPCFTIGCKVNYEAEIWGANRDVGGRSGMEKVMISPLL